MNTIRAAEAYGEQMLARAATESARVRTLAHWTVRHLHKRALSSPEALRRSLTNRQIGLQRRLQKQLAKKSVSLEEARANVLDEDTGDRLDEEWEAAPGNHRQHRRQPDHAYRPPQRPQVRSGR